METELEEILRALDRAIADPGRTPSQKEVLAVFRTLAERYAREQDYRLFEVRPTVQRRLGEWDARPPYRGPSGVMAAPPSSPACARACADWLEEILTPHARPLCEVVALAQTEGFSRADLAAARVLLGRAVRDGLAYKTPRWWVGRGPFTRWTSAD